MSKSVRKKHLVRRQARPHSEKPVSPEKRERTQRLVILTAIVVLAAIPFAMGKYIEFNSPCAFDGGAYVYSAEHIVNGARIGIDEKPSAQMGTLLVNMLGVRLFGFNDIGPKLIQMLLQAAALVLMFVTLRKLFGTLAAAVGVIVASIYLSAPIIAKYGNVKEQHMIAFMVLGACCFVLYQLSGRWWQAVLAGAFLIFAPMFKETGTSALGAVGLFVLVQPLLKHCTWKKTGIDILLLSAGAILVLGPICLWLAASGSPIDYYPYCFLYKPIVKTVENPPPASEPALPKSETGANKVQNAAAKQGLLMKFLPAYVRDSWQTMTPEQRRQAKLRVLRWYGVLILPIVLAAGAVILRILKMILSRLSKSKAEWKTRGDKFVLLFAVWWLLDMAYVWISPRSYEQYYLPLNASGAMLGGYLVAAYYDKAREAVSKPKWLAIGVLALLLMVAMSWRIFAGVTKSPHSGTTYLNYRTHLPERRNGYAQRLEEAYQHRNEGARASWELVGRYIRDNSTSKDKIYVWGWVPGIYVEAQRLSPAPKAFEGTMHTLSPQELSERVAELLSSFRKQPPKFIVDTRKIHFPWDRPPLELWPRTQKGFLPTNPQVVSQYEAMYAKMLRERISDPNEAKRFEAMKPFRDYVMRNYRVVRTFGEMVLFQHK
jgi:Dolichyl-phosphate-mannose-protein mannosyltransferase